MKKNWECLETNTLSNAIMAEVQIETIDIERNVDCPRNLHLRLKVRFDVNERIQDLEGRQHLGGMEFQSKSEVARCHGAYIGSSLGKNLGGTGQDSTSTYKADKDTMAASVPMNNNSREVVKTVIPKAIFTLADNRQDVAYRQKRC